MGAIPQQRVDALRRMNPAAVTAYLKRYGQRVVRIYSAEHSSYWRPGGAGYTHNVWHSGLFTLAEAWEKTSHCGPEKRIHYELVRADEREEEPGMDANGRE